MSTPIHVGRRGQTNTTAIFEYKGQSLHVHTGMDQIVWSYTMNTANFPTYGGEVIQILSCYVDDLELQGTLANYDEMQAVYDFFLRFINDGGSGDRKNGQVFRNETPMKFTYGPRRWVMDIYVKELPGYRQGREVVAPTWQIKAHIVSHAGDVDELSQLIITEARYREIVGSEESFGTNGKMFFIDENPFSDPHTKEHGQFDQFQRVDDYYTKLLPSYLNGDLDVLFAETASKPAFDPSFGPKGNLDDNSQPRKDAQEAARRSKGRRGR